MRAKGCTRARTTQPCPAQTHKIAGVDAAKQSKHSGPLQRQGGVQTSSIEGAGLASCVHTPVAKQVLVSTRNTVSRRAPSPPPPAQPHQRLRAAACQVSSDAAHKHAHTHTRVPSMHAGAQVMHHTVTADSALEP
jgi:hypothetical protein